MERKERSDKGQLRVPLHQCTICNYKHRIKNNTLRHYLNNHASLSERQEKCKYYCKICDYGYTTENKYKQHLETRGHSRRSNN